jgi:hypothetical protein
MSDTVQGPFIRKARASRIARFTRLGIAKRQRVQRRWLCRISPAIAART